MFLYADPEACPGCRAAITYGSTGCASCDIRLDDARARDLFLTLRQADTLVAQLRSLPAPAPVPVPASVAAPPAPRQGGLSGASVPKILLGLGATCLLVAALVFLAVAWSALGVGGRTAVLVLLTAAAGGAAAWMARKDLRAGAESLATVALGLLAMDLAGADNAGWLGSLSASGFLIVSGTVVGAAGLATAYAAQRTPMGSLVSGQVVGAVGALVACLGLVDSLDSASTSVALVIATLLTAGVAALCSRLSLPFAAGGIAVEAGCFWLALAVSGLIRLDEPSLARVWGDLEVWPTLVAAALAALVAVPRTLPGVVRVAAASVATLLGTVAVTVVAFDESRTTVALVELAVVVAYAVLAARLRDGWRWVTVTPSGIAALGLFTSAVTLAGHALVALLDVAPWSQSPAAFIDAHEMLWRYPLLLPAGTAGVLLATATLLRCLGQPSRPWLPSAAGLVVAATALVPALYEVALWVEVLVLVGVAGALAAAVLRVTPGNQLPLGCLAAGAAALALGSALASDWLTAVVLAVLTAVGLLATTSENTVVRSAGNLGLPAALGGLLWTVGHLAEVDTEWRALPILLVLGAAMLLRPDYERELATGVAGVLAVAASVVETSGVDQTWLAVYLTVGGVVATASALLHPSRRLLGWVGLALFTLAQWIRLEQLGVDTVEAYTLPLAVVLLVVGTVAMLRSDVSSRRALSAGLGLALVPSLLQVLALEPVSPRALLLGLGCLVCVVAGVQLRWAAPLVAGAVTGALLVLREAAHAQVLEQWMVIGLVGIALTVVGVTWEKRQAELRLAAAYLRRLR